MLPPEEAETTGSSGGEEPLLAAPAAAAFALFPPRSFEVGVFAVAAVSREIAPLSFAAAAETEGDADGLMLQVLPVPPPPPRSRCGVEWPESGMEQDGGAEVEVGASGGRLEEEVEEAATPGCCCEEGDADIVVEVDASASMPPLLAPRRCVAVVAVPIRQDAEPPSEKEKSVGEKEKKGERWGTDRGRNDEKKGSARLLPLSRPLKRPTKLNEEGALDSLDPL